MTKTAYWLGWTLGLSLLLIVLMVAARLILVNPILARLDRALPILYRLDAFMSHRPRPPQ